MKLNLFILIFFAITHYCYSMRTKSIQEYRGAKNRFLVLTIDTPAKSLPQANQLPSLNASHLRETQETVQALLRNEGVSQLELNELTQALNNRSLSLDDATRQNALKALDNIMLLQTINLRAALGQDNPAFIVAANQAALFRAAEKAQAEARTARLVQKQKKPTARRRKAAAQRTQETAPCSKDERSLKKKENQYHNR